MDFRLIRSEFGQDTPETKRILAERRTHPVVASRSSVTLVEDQVDDLENRSETGSEVGPARNFERDSLFSEGSFGADDALGDSRLRDEESSRDFLGSVERTG